MIFSGESLKNNIYIRVSSPKNLNFDIKKRGCLDTPLVENP
jgi:hypothetical protein